MEGTIAIGTKIIAVETAWKAAVIALLILIATVVIGFTTYIIHWLNT